MLTLHAVLTRLEGDGTITYAAEYAEPGYSSPKKGILFANWNPDPLGRVSKLAEKAGYEIEWSDEWTTCTGCNKAVRTSPDSYGWTRSYWDTDDGDTLCRECVLADPESYLESLEGDARKAETIGVDLDAHGYRKLNTDSYENGWHPGQNDSPEVVAKSLKARGVERFLFKIDDVGQFDVRFSVYVHEDEQPLLADTEPESKLPYDPGTEMGKALRGEHSDHYTMTTRTLTPEEFISGSWTKEK